MLRFELYIHTFRLIIIGVSDGLEEFQKADLRALYLTEPNIETIVSNKSLKIVSSLENNWMLTYVLYEPCWRELKEAYEENIKSDMNFEFKYSGHCFQGNLRLTDSELDCPGSCFYKLFTTNVCPISITLDLNTCYAEDFMASYIKSMEDRQFENLFKGFLLSPSAYS